MFLRRWFQPQKRISQQQQQQQQQQNDETATPHSGCNASASAVVAPAGCLHELCFNIRRNQLKELQLNWLESQFILHIRNLRVLEKALYSNTSIRSIALGWRHANRELLVATLKCLARNCQQLERIRLILNDWVPENVLRNLFYQQASLQCVEIRSVQVVRKTTLGRYDPSALRSKNEDTLASNNIVSRVIVPYCLLLSSHQSLQELHLADCSLTDKSAVLLADAIHVRGGLSVLSVRLNKSLTSHGIKVLIQAPVMRILDLSLLDMGDEIGSGLGAAVAARPWPLTELLLSGNYRLGATALASLFTELCCNKLAGLNISYCDLGEQRTSLIFEQLAQLHQQPILLQKLILHGCRIGHDECIAALTKMIQANVPIRTLHMNDPSTPKIVSAQQLQSIRQALCHNYELEDIVLDFYRTELLEWKQIAFYLQLNRAGRRILRGPKGNKKYKQDNDGRPIDWFDVAAKAENDFDVLYWIVRESAEHFAHWDRLHELMI